MKKHPSGRPIRRREWKDAVSIWRRPPEEPLTPGLQRKTNKTSAIGFHIQQKEHDNNEEDHSSSRYPR